jgi:hypothetical protein
MSAHPRHRMMYTCEKKGTEIDMRIFMYVHPEIDNKKVQSIVLGARPKGKKKDKKNLLTQDSTR